MNRKKFAGATLLGLVIYVGFFFNRSTAPGLLRLTFLDVGQGDATIIQTPSGHVVVIDTGNLSEEGREDEGRKVVVPALRRLGLSKVDVLMLTHPHADHIGGAKSLLKLIPVELVMDNGQSSASPLVSGYLQEARVHNVNYRRGRRGQSFEFGDGVTMRVLAPTEEEAGGKPNNASLVVRLDYGKTSAILTGDAEAEEEEEVVRSGTLLDCNLYKAGHHGSKTSTSPRFLEAMHPQAAVISCGKNNLYGHPHRLTVEHLKKAGIRIYRTDLQGQITCELDGSQLKVKPLRE